MIRLRVTWTPRKHADMGVQLTVGRILDRLYTLIGIELTPTLCRATIEGDGEDLSEKVHRCLAFAAVAGSLQITCLEPRPTCLVDADIVRAQECESSGHDPSTSGR